jgi:hypothetical protein
VGQRRFIGFATDNGRYIAQFMVASHLIDQDVTEVLLDLFKNNNAPEQLFDIMMQNNRSVTFQLDHNKKLSINILNNYATPKNSEKFISEGFNITSFNTSLSPSDPALWLAGSFSQPYKEPQLRHGDIGYIFSADLKRLIVVHITDSVNHEKETSTFAKYSLETADQYEIYHSGRMSGISDSNYRKLRESSEAYKSHLAQAKERERDSLMLKESMYYSLQKLNR